MATQPTKLEKQGNITDIAHLISIGKTRGEVIAYIENDLGISKRMSTEYYRDALRTLIIDDDFLGDYKRAVQAQNYDRLEKIICDTINGNASEKKVAISAISELNKMINPGGNQVTIANNTEGEQIIKIDFQ